MAFLPAIMTSVARLIPSNKDSLHPYKLSNLDLVTESFTLIAGIFNVPCLAISYKRATPVVVSSDTPIRLASNSGYCSCITTVKSPPSSNNKFGVQPSGPRIVCATHHQYSSSDSPFQAKTGIPLAAIAAAAWSCVEKILHDDQRTSAPNANNVSINTAV